jgi:acetyl esterase/lipase
MEINMSRKLTIPFLFLLLLQFTIATAQQAGYIDIDLWPKGLPNSNGKDHLQPSDSLKIYKPSIRVFLPAKEKATGRAVVACPGGGYFGLAYNHEGYDFAPFFNRQGIALIVLKYRMPFGHREVPFSDAEEAIRLVKERAKEWNINPQDVGIMGASAGGHLASTIATRVKPELRPAFQILLYPVITMDTTYAHRGSRRNLLGEHPSEELATLYSNEKQVTKETPRAFIVFSDDDKSVPSVNGVNYYLALRKLNIPASLHIYPSGGHGWGIRETFKYHNAFLMDLEDWLKSF